MTRPLPVRLSPRPVRAAAHAVTALLVHTLAVLVVLAVLVSVMFSAALFIPQSSLLLASVGLGLAGIYRLSVENTAAVTR